MTALDRHRGTAPPDWDATVAHLGGNVFHTSVWAEHQRCRRGVEPLFLLARDDAGGARAGAVAFLEQSGHPLASWMLRDLVLPTHPFGRDRSAVAELMAACEAEAGRLGCRRLRVDSFMSGESPFVPSAGGFQEHQRVEFVLDLDRDRDTLWKSLRKDQRERIRRLEREGVAVEVGSAPEDLQGLRAAREFTQARQASRGNSYELEQDDAFYAALYEHLLRRRSARLFVARQGGEVVGALFFATFSGRACSIYSGSTPAGYALGAQSGLFWAAVEAFRAEGYRELNRGGVPASAADPGHPLHGLYQFKLRLGTTPVLCRSGSKVLSPVREGLARLGRRLRRATAGV